MHVRVCGSPGRPSARGHLARLLCAIVIARGAVLEPAYAENFARAESGFDYHAINRGNGRATIFHKAHV